MVGSRSTDLLLRTRSFREKPWIFRMQRIQRENMPPGSVSGTDINGRLDSISSFEQPLCSISLQHEDLFVSRRNWQRTLAVLLSAKSTESEAACTHHVLVSQHTPSTHGPIKNRLPYWLRPRRCCIVISAEDANQRNMFEKKPPTAASTPYL